jgi:ribosomal protein L16 Arg81 hydroxylase
MILQQLLGDFPAATFLEQHFYRQPYASPGGCARLANRTAAEWTAAGTCERLLGQTGLDLLVTREGQPWPGPVLDQASGQAALVEGYTLCLRQADRHDPALAQLAADFHQDFLAPIDVHVYCTPAGKPGFSWHYDAEDVFILQTEGKKDWWLRKNTVNPWPLVETIPADMRYEREIMPALHCTLAAGDWLYIPAGYWHRTAASELSTSLSVGILSPTGIDLFDLLRKELLQDLRWRERLPVLGAANIAIPEQQAAAFRAITHALSNDLAQRLAQLSWQQMQEAMRQGAVEQGESGRQGQGEKRPTHDHH